MRIAICSHVYPSIKNPSYGKFIKDQTDLLEHDSNHTIQLFIPTPLSIPFTEKWRNSKSDYLKNSVNLTPFSYLSIPRLLFPTITQRTYSNSLIKELESFNPDIIHFHWLYPSILAIPDLHKKGIKFIINLHGSDWYLAISKKNLFPYIKKAFECCDLILCSGPDLKNDVVTTFPELVDKFDCSYNFVDEDKLELYTPKKRTESRTKLAWNQDALHILTVANLRPEKGVDLLVSAIIKYNKLHTDNTIIFHIIGINDRSVFSQSIHHKIESENLKNVQIHPPVTGDELIDYYYASDFLISASRREGFGLAIVEAATTGLPIISTKVGIANELVLDDVGILCETNEDSIYNAILKMTEKLDGYNSKLIRSRAVSRFGKNKFLNRLQHFYHTLIS